MAHQHREMRRIAALSLGALGVVFGDIGTSPLYALRECLNNVQPSEENIFGLLSLIFWVFVLVVSLKYLVLVLRADNDGEGGNFALIALLERQKSRFYPLFLAIGVFGASLLFGDGILTPAVSVLSAVEGLEIISPSLKHAVVPLTLFILVFLFSNQHRGTAHMGRLFGPILAFWFGTLAVLGLVHIAHRPSILGAMAPWHAFHFLFSNPAAGFKILSSVFLVVTGAEALYADIGHFGKLPIRLTWFGAVFPALVLNYFGQGAHLLLHPESAHNPFYSLAPHWFLSPLVGLATVATIIASKRLFRQFFL